MTVEQVMAELKVMGSESCRRIYKNHGAPEPLFGVKVQDLKKIQKKIKKDHMLSLQLFDTGNSDAQYLAGLIADEKMISKSELQQWAEKGSWYMVSEYSVPWIAAESAHGWELGLKWIDSKKESVQSSGWSTLASLMSIKSDSNLDILTLRKLLYRIEKEIDGAGNRVRYSMNSFVIAAGCFVKDLTADAQKTGNAISHITVDMGNTSCKLPPATAYIRKVIEKGKLGSKKKMARC